MGVILALSFTGICAPVSEAAVRSGAERESGKEWKTLRGGTSQCETGEGNISEAGGQAAQGPVFSLTVYFLRNFSCREEDVLYVYSFTYLIYLFLYLFKYN